jgi:hypothetical protein
MGGSGAASMGRVGTPIERRLALPTQETPYPTPVPGASSIAPKRTKPSLTYCSTPSEGGVPDRPEG